MTKQDKIMSFHPKITQHRRKKCYRFVKKTRLRFRFHFFFVPSQQKWITTT